MSDDANTRKRKERENSSSDEERETPSKRRKEEDVLLSVVIKDEPTIGPSIPFHSESDYEIGPTQASSNNSANNVKEKPKKILKFEKFYLDMLPCAQMYEKSYMHRSIVTHSVVTPSEFIITGSEDGHIKFWKKLPKGIEAVKHFIAHLGPITNLVASEDGLYAATTSIDKTLKIYDVVNFDMITIIDLPFNASACCWVYKIGATKPIIAVSSSEDSSPVIHLYDFHENTHDGGLTKPLEVFRIHKHSIILMQYNSAFNCVISIDKKGIIEYWDTKVGDGHEFPTSEVTFKYKTSTDLYEFVKSKTLPTSLSISSDGKLFATMGADRQVRIFKFRTGKLHRKYDESLEVFKEIQKDDSSKYKLDYLDFGKRVAVEGQLTKLWTMNRTPPANVIFDQSGNFIMYSTLLGIKLVNIFHNTLVQVLGKVENTERFLWLSLYQGRTKGSFATGTYNANAEVDPTIIATSLNKNRFYLFSRREPEEGDDKTIGRDVFNEKPMQDELRGIPKTVKEQRIAKTATIHTNLGDIFVKLFGDKCPKTVENFTVHCKNNYYNGLIFHRVVKSFMVQTGDPLGDGTGGNSIWNRDFEDEFHHSLRHEPFTLSMANTGPNTNRSQFFITTVPCEHLDNKHTVFGRVTKGMDVVSAIERVPVDKTKERYKPWEDVKIINIDVFFQDKE